MEGGEMEIREGLKAMEGREWEIWEGISHPDKALGTSALPNIHQF